MSNHLTSPILDRKITNSLDFQFDIVNTRGMTTPRYTHNCNHCVFLGHYQEFDLYVCHNHHGIAGGVLTLRNNSNVLGRRSITDHSWPWLGQAGPGWNISLRSRRACIRALRLAADANLVSQETAALVTTDCNARSWL